MLTRPVWQKYLTQTLAQGELSYQYCGLGSEANDINDINVIALHGWLDNSASFTPMLEFLLQQEVAIGIDVYALDFAGHGHSFHRPPGCFYTIWDYAIDVAQFITAKSLDKVVLLGHSMGACVAPLVASILPDRVQAICAIEALGPISTAVMDTSRQLHKAVSRQRQQQQRTAKVFASVEEALMARLGAKISLHKAAASLLVDRAIMPCEGGFTWRSDRRATLPSPVRFSEDQVQAILTALQCPVTLVVGDHLQTDEQLTVRAQVVTQLRRLPLSGGHHLHMENQIPGCVQALMDLVVNAVDKEQ
ncbi:MAG: alpha/beta hydrolase [Gammaproteobacteria bacterium]|jgi:pimeloyl-ACP methyl ester carboxylesterase|nr:alpha/beta hydrolase [Gammaproteobacteria bacterium]